MFRSSKVIRPKLFYNLRVKQKKLLDELLEKSNLRTIF